MKFPNEQEALYQTMHNSHVGYMGFNQGIRYMRSWLRRLKDPPASILEMGCGNGLLCKSLAMMGYTVTGTDIVPGSYDRRGYAFVGHDIQSGPLPFKNDEFDYCVSFDVLEHLEPKWVGHAVFEMARVAQFDEIIGTAACFKNGPFHRTVKEPRWWVETISQSCIREMEYRVFESAVGKTVLFQTKKEN